ncbi:MAG: hypothetical protein ABUK01_08020 [Leptospirales bacterium]
MKDLLTTISGLYEDNSTALKRLNRVNYSYKKVLGAVYLPILLFMIIMQSGYYATRSLDLSYLWRNGILSPSIFIVYFLVFIFIIILSAQSAANKTLVSFSHGNINKRIMFCAIPALFSKAFYPVPIAGGLIFIVGIIYSVYLLYNGFYVDETVPKEKLSRFFNVFILNTLFLTIIAFILKTVTGKFYNLIILLLG